MVRIVSVIETGLRGIAALCLVLLSALVVLQVAMRYGWGSSPIFTEEFARYAMIWMALLAAAVGVRDASHIRIDFVPLALGAVAPRIKCGLEAALDVVSLTAFLVLAWYGIDMMMFAAGQTSEGLQIPLSYPYAAVAVSFAFAALFAVLRLLSRGKQA